MKGIILAAGRGSRMGNLTRQKPKCLITYKGVTLLERQVNALRDSGIQEIGIVTGYKVEALANFELVKFHNYRWKETNMVSSLECAKRWLESDNCVVSYSDIFYDTHAISSLIFSDAQLSIAYDPHWKQLWEGRFKNPLCDAETFKVDSGGFIKEIGGRAKDINEIEGQYMGLLRFTPIGWERLQHVRRSTPIEGQDTIDMTSLLNQAISQGCAQIKAVRYEGTWGEIDSASDLEYYEKK